MNFAKSDQHNIEAFFLPQNAQTNLKLFSEADGVVLETLANRVDQEEFIILEILDNRSSDFSRNKPIQPKPLGSN
jgi:Holliday junction resolvasome RuvABC endonuclease subunit